MNTTTFAQEIELALIEKQENEVEEQRLKNSVTVITSQNRENYGAHDWSGEGACPQHWKNKGRSVYIFKGILTQKQSSVITGCINSADDYFTETIVSQDETCSSFNFYEDYEKPAYIFFENDSLMLTEENYHNSKLKYKFELYDNGVRRLIK